MKSITLALTLALALLTHAPKADARPAERRGTVEVAGHTVKAVTAGPVLLHGYAAFSGGALFVAPRRTGTDADCATALADHDARPVALAADRMAYVPVGAGQVACLVTDARRPFELLWHAFETADHPQQTLLANAKTGSTIR
jgi:hypothetical protein